MSKLEVFSETPISGSELMQELARIKKRDKELSFRGTKTEEYVQQFISLDHAKSKELFDKLNKLNVPRLKENHIIKLVDLLPVTVDDVKLVLQGSTITVNQDNLKKIAKTIEEFSAK
jgi:DNA-directed RNA polymerase subunit F